MLFASQLFILGFLPIAFIGFSVARRYGWAEVWLIAVSIAFYCYAGAAAVAVVLASAVANYFASVWMMRALTPKLRSHVLTGAIIANLLVLGYFKYFAFLVT